MSTKTKILSLSAIAATLLSPAAFAEIQANLSIDNAANLVGSSDVVANISYTNTDSQPVSMLSYLMKANSNGDLEENLFTVTLDGKAVEYQGMHVKRPAPTKADYITIRPGQTVSYKVELSGVYDLKQSGNYTFQYNATNMNMFADQPMVNRAAAIMGMDGVHSNEAEAFVTKSASSYIGIELSKAKKGKPCNPRKETCDGGGGDPDPSGIEFTGSCSSGEQSNLISALAAAKDMANDSISSLNGSSGDRYNSWFGSYSSSRHNTVSGNFDSIKDALDNKPLTFDCSCNQSYFAYVYPNQPYKVYFCKAFWNARETGTDSRGGTIIHEMSHFNAVAGTDDVVYGQSGARALAISNPNDAVKNADSHEYFAENNPSEN
ncbi:MAG: M35 family metallo-endopeptidase [Psychrosphaera sp.]|nr:M35 family metallo-endopeptidase [Psychrosphaera sp.]